MDSSLLSRRRRRPPRWSTRPGRTPGSPGTERSPKTRNLLPHRIPFSSLQCEKHSVLLPKERPLVWRVCTRRSSEAATLQRQGPVHIWCPALNPTPEASIERSLERNTRLHVVTPAVIGLAPWKSAKAINLCSIIRVKGHKSWRLWVCLVCDHKFCGNVQESEVDAKFEVTGTQANNTGYSDISSTEFTEALPQIQGKSHTFHTALASDICNKLESSENTANNTESSVAARSIAECKNDLDEKSDKLEIDPKERKMPHKLVPPTVQRVINSGKQLGMMEGYKWANLVSKSFPDLVCALYLHLHGYMDLEFMRCLDDTIDTSSERQHDSFLRIRCHALEDEYCRVEQLYAFSMSDVQTFIEEYESFLWVCPICDLKKFMDTGLLLSHSHICSRHPRAVLPRHQPILDKKFSDGALQDDVDGFTFCEDQQDMICFSKSSGVFKWLLYAPSSGIWARPIPEILQKKCEKGCTLLESIKEKMKTLPADRSSTKYAEALPQISRRSGTIFSNMPRWIIEDPF